MRYACAYVVNVRGSGSVAVGSALGFTTRATVRYSCAYPVNVRGSGPVAVGSA